MRVPHPTSPASPPVSTSTTTQPLPPLRQKQGPATRIPTHDDVEEELLDYGDAKDLEEIDVDSTAAIDGEDDTEMPDLQSVQAPTAPAP